MSGTTMQERETRVWELLGAWISSVARPDVDVAPSTEMVAAIKALTEAGSDVHRLAELESQLADARTEATALRVNEENLRADARRYYELRKHLRITHERIDPDNLGPFWHFLRLRTERLIIPGSGNVDRAPLTDTILDAAVQARYGDPNAYFDALWASHTAATTAAQSANPSAPS